MIAVINSSPKSIPANFVFLVPILSALNVPLKIFALSVNLINIFLMDIALVIALRELTAMLTTNVLTVQIKTVAMYALLKPPINVLPAAKDYSLTLILRNVSHLAQMAPSLILIMNAKNVFQTAPHVLTD
jgi:hypothetical protein